MTFEIKPISSYHDGPYKELAGQIEKLKATGKAFAAKLESLRASQQDDENSDHDSEARLQSLIDGVALPTARPWGAQILEMQTNIRDVDNALDLMAARMRVADEGANRRMVDDIRPAHNASAKRLAEALIVAHEAHAEYFAAKRHMLGNGFRVYDLFPIDSEEFLGIPNDSNGNLAFLFREAVKCGYIRSVPKGMK
jgi:hypothetical protein